MKTLPPLYSEKKEYKKPEYIGQILYIKPTYIVSVPEFDTVRNYNTVARVKNNENLKHNRHDNRLSEKAQKRIKTAINWLCVSAKAKRVYQATTKKNFNFTVNLITLTLPDTEKPINDNMFKKQLLHPLFVYLKKYHNFNNYVWKLEFQENGKLHVHITSDTYIDCHILRHLWNRLLINNGFMADFEKKHKHTNPNSTDIHAVWKVKNLGAYLAKYLSKNEQNVLEIKGRIWGCSHELSDKNKCILGLDRDEVGYEMRSLFNEKIKYSVIETPDTLTGLMYRQAELFFVQAHDWKELIKGKIKQAYDNHRFLIRNGFSATQNNINPI